MWNWIINLIYPAKGLTMNNSIVVNELEEYIDIPDINSYDAENNISDLYTKIRYIDPEINSDIPIDFQNITEESKPIIDNILLNPNIDGYNTLQLKQFFHSIYMQEINNRINDLLISGVDEKNIKILDVGCGTGELFNYIYTSYSNERYSGININYTGIDFNDNMISLAKSRVANLQELPLNLKCNYENNTLEGFLNSSEDTYDVIIFSNVFDYDYFKISNKQFISDYFNTVYNFKDMNDFVTTNIALYYDKLLNIGGSLSANFINDNKFSREHGEESLYILDSETLEFLTNNICEVYTLKKNYLNILTDVIHLYKVDKVF